MSTDAPINFFKGHPSFRLLPGKNIAKTANDILKPERLEYDDLNEDRHPLSYGPKEGSLWVRCVISQFVNKCFKPLMPTKPEYINLTGGASYGIMNILEQCTLPHTGYTRQAFLISPTYFLINETFIDAGFGGKLTAVNETQNGLDVEFLEAKLAEFEYDALLNPQHGEERGLNLINMSGRSRTKKVYRYVMYLVPTFSNPSGKTYSVSTRLKLVELARKYDILLISDDVYDLLVYDQPCDALPKCLPRLTHLDRASYEYGENGYGNTISNATFSKVIAPGLRCGYQESVNMNLVYQLSQGGANISGGSPAQLNSMLIGTLFINGEADVILEDLRTIYKYRATVLYDAIKKYLPKKTIYSQQAGGYFSWCTLPEGYNCHDICEILEKDHNIILANGSHFEVYGDERNWGLTSVRISISFLEADDIAKGVKIWGQVCHEYANKHHLTF
ncbi:2-aminoadipate transaminase Ecym_5542 [Eremothecium cymbalariae DBVPG|uniref:Aminotransferase class I/classII large domain-containing protein n=1 Tax=Eremothecium cymbalariae (strain CBS 270.75 / DBVPG 7215 / KCTC 17166 / NRRL Y-17582) TaxID=931890 RepID=I6NDZ0_ERECY|nr:hypothetical protein Ecym_5542 [Eremothecium cymbalariae DBVPG\